MRTYFMAERRERFVADVEALKREHERLGRAMHDGTDKAEVMRMFDELDLHITEAWNRFAPPEMRIPVTIVIRGGAHGRT